MNRHNARIIAVMALYNYDFHHYSFEETLYSFDEILRIEAEEDYPVDIDKEFARELVKGVINNIESIDKIISEYLIGYTIDRLSFVDRAIIRLAVYELKETNLAKGIIINEALEITKTYSSVDLDKQVKFNNRLLDNIAGGLNGRTK